MAAFVGVGLALVFLPRLMADSRTEFQQRFFADNFFACFEWPSEEPPEARCRRALRKAMQQVDFPIPKEWNYSAAFWNFKGTVKVVIGYRYPRHRVYYGLLKGTTIPPGVRNWVVNQRDLDTRKDGASIAGH